MVDFLIQERLVERDDLFEWLGPYIEPESQAGVVRHGGAVNFELNLQGPIIEGDITRMCVETESHDWGTIYDVTLRVPISNEPVE